MATSKMSGVVQHLRRTVLLRDGAGLTDGQLLTDYISRHDEAAVAALVRRHGPMVWGICRRVLRNHHDAEDAFQTTFLVLVRKAASIASRELVANWLYGVAHQTALKARATAAKRNGRERQVTEMPEPAVAEQDLWRDLQPVLDEELSRLPDKYRAVIVLCDLEGKTRKEAARQLACPEGTIGGWLARARVMLAKRLAQRGVALSGGALAAVLSENVASAGVPTSVVTSTIQAASLLAAGQAAATGVISAKVTALTEGVLKSMSLTKLKIGAAMLLVFAAVGLGVSWPDSDPLSAKQPIPKEVRSQEPKKDRPQEPRPITVSGRVAYLAWSPDGTLVTSSGQEPKEGARLGNYTIQFWDAKTGKEKLSLGEVAETWLERPTFSPDGKQLALLSYKKEDKRNVFEVQIYDTAKGELVREIKECHYLGGWPAFSPDGKTLATTGSKSEPFKGVLGRGVAEVKLWDVATGEMKRLLEDKRELDFFNNFGGPAFAPDGKTLATPGVRFEYTRDMLDMVPEKPVANPFIPKPQVHNEVVLWDLDTGKLKRVLKGGSSLFSVAFSPDGKSLLAADEEGEVRVLEVATGKLERTLVHERGVSCEAVLSRDGKCLATKGRKFNKESRRMEGSVNLWNFRTGEEKQTLPESELKGLGPVVFSPDGKRLALGIGSNVRFWDIEKAAFEK